jgi:hypothetical protein
MTYIQLTWRAGLRNDLGRVGDAYNKLPLLYRQLAIEIQDEAAGIIRAESRKRLKNPRKGNRGTLARVTRNQQNRAVGKNGFAVGVKTYLDRSAAKYARIIEEGSAFAAPRYSTTMISGGWAGNAAYGRQFFIPAPAERRTPGLPRRAIEPLGAYRRAFDRVGTPARVRQIWRAVLIGEGVAGTRGPLRKQYRLPLDFPNIGNVRY